MPDWLRALERASLIFWEDPNPLTWGQTVALLFTTAGFYALARLPFAGGGTFFDLSSLVVVLEIIVAVILVMVGDRLGPMETWAPNLIRLLTIHLVLAMIILAVNNVWQWATAMQSERLIAILPAILATLILSYHTVNRRSDGMSALRRAGFYASVSLVTVVTAVIVYYAVLPF